MATEIRLVPIQIAYMGVRGDVILFEGRDQVMGTIPRVTPGTYHELGNPSPQSMVS